MEINLVQQVELKLLLADTDVKLNAALAIFLVPLIQKLASADTNVVRKVIEVLHFVKKRKSSSPRDVIFPFDKLFSIFEQSVFDTKPGISRQNQQLLAFMGAEISEWDAEQMQAQIPVIKFVRGLRNLNDFNIDIRNNAAEQLSLFLLVLSKSRSLDSVEVTSPQWEEPDLKILQEKLPQIFLLDLKHRSVYNQLGLSVYEVEVFVNHGAKVGLTIPSTNDAKLFTLRQNILSLAKKNCNVFKNVLVAAMGDQMLDISRAARSEVNKLRDFDIAILQKWALFGSESLRLEIVELMIRKQLLEQVEPEVILSAFTKSSNLRLKQSALQLLQDLMKTDPSHHDWSKDIVQSFRKALRQFIVDEGWPVAQVHSPVQVRLRQQCYELLGAFDSSPATLSFLFQSLERDRVDMSASIQKALTKVLESTTSEQVDEKTLLRYMERSQNDRTRYAALQFAQLKLDPRSPIQRLICLMGVSPKNNRSDIVSEAQKGLALSASSEELPNFSEMLTTLRKTLNIASQTDQQLIESSLLFLLCCMLRKPTFNLEWISELITSLSIHTSPLVGELKKSSELPEFTSLLLEFFKYSTSSYQPVIPLILQHCIPEMTPEFFKDSVDTKSLLDILRDENNSYGPFVAEYLPMVSPETKIEGENSNEILARAFYAAVSNGFSKEAVDLAFRTENVDALSVLAACGAFSFSEISSNEKLLKILKKNQLAYALVSLTSDTASREGALKELIDFKSRAFDEIVTNGEAISALVSGWGSRVLQDKYPNIFRTSRGQTWQSWDLEQVALKEIAIGIKGSPESRRIACVRLLCLTQHSFYNIHERLGIANGIQACFMNLLTDSDDVTQQSAGRGLEILFQSGNNDKNLQNGLLSNLVSSFTDDKSAKKHTAGTLTEDTQVFEPDMLPSDPQGKGSISTYKDVMNLANETGDSSLVYKFMSLSANSQIWSGRKGIAFSLQQILAKSELSNQIFDGSPLGRKLIPKLFRYLYDPVEVTRTAMKNIWHAIVPSSKRVKILKTYFNEISNQVFEGVIEREWRVREASTLALADLVSQGLIGNSIEAWRAGFRAVDDIKESVSKAGSALLHSLTNAMVRACNTTKNPDLSEVLPFLLKGLSDKATMKYSLDTLLKLSVTSGFKPYAAQTIEELTLQLSSIEPQALNYLALHSNNQEIVDEVRAEGLRSSPVMQGLEAMIERGTPSPEELWAILPRIVKNSVGVSSKLAGARLITLASMFSYGEAKFDNETLLKASISELWGSNKLVSDHYASALAYMMRKMSLPLVLRYVNALQATFVDSGSDDVHKREIIAQALWNLSSNASDVYGSISSSLVPLVFVGSCLSIPKEAETYKKTWDDNAGSDATVRLYRIEIVRFCVSLLEKSSVHTIKSAAGAAIDRALPLGQTVSVDEAVTATNSILSNLSGRSWTGKENIFAALVSIYPSVQQESLLRTSEDRVLNEIKRKNVDYRIAIIPSVVRFLLDVAGHRDSAVLAQIRDTVISATLEVCDNDEPKTVVAAKASLRLGVPEIYEHLLALGKWTYRALACEVLETIPFDSALWEKVTRYCANDYQSENVRFKWAQCAVRFRSHEAVKQDIRAQVQQEKSSVVLHELNNAL